MADRQRGNEINATGKAVAANVKRARVSAGLTQAELSTRLGEMGHPIRPAAIGKIETADRRVEVDDLMALALALDTAPAALLLPAGDLDEIAAVTGGTGSVGVIWEWAFGVTSLAGNTRAYQARSLPSWVSFAGLEILSDHNYELKFGLGSSEPQLISRSIVER